MTAALCQIAKIGDLNVQHPGQSGIHIVGELSPDLGAGSKMGFDATVKLPAEGRVRTWPKELEMDAKTKELVTRRWKEYGL